MDDKQTFAPGDLVALAEEPTFPPRWLEALEFAKLVRSELGAGTLAEDRFGPLVNLIVTLITDSSDRPLSPP